MQLIQRTWTCLALSACLMGGYAQSPVHSSDRSSVSGQDKNKMAVHRSEREDGRDISSYAIVHGLLRQTQPQCAYEGPMSKRQFKKWQKRLTRAMEDLMRFPEVSGQPAPKCVQSEKRDGYTLEKWEFYPFPQAVSTFLVLKPDQLAKQEGGQLPAVLCIPGSGRTKEGLAGEPGVSARFNERYTDPKVCMALDVVKAGYVAVAVDNAAAGESSDLERWKNGSNYDYDVVSRYLLEMGWHWLGYTSYLNNQVLQWMKQQDFIRNDRIVVSGFSLGTEPMMVLGILNRDVYGFVYNDFLCQTQERTLVMTQPNRQMRRPFPNSIRHLIPNYWHYFNFPDVAAALAPRHLIFTEGGLDRDFRLVQSAYRDAGQPQHVTCHHYPKFADPAHRKDVETLLPAEMDGRTYLQAVNVDPSGHYFKYELVIPWLQKIFAE